ncbi:complement C4-like [Tyto alba]|uniref:complement C4-like n=1 Tax=Tyto alba TaxID=56313 RepID=UPI001C680E84|nr:complement C4-like [Tyto alba]
MAMAEMSLLSGFRPHRLDLDGCEGTGGVRHRGALLECHHVPPRLRDVVDRWISHYELSRTRLVIYLDEVPTRRQCISFGATQEVVLGQIQPAMAAIYDYYELAQHCTVSYSDPHRSSVPPTLCSSQLYLCAQGVCPRLWRALPALMLGDHLDFACYSPHINYALVVQALAQSEVGPFLAFEIEILEVLLGAVPK